MFGTPPARSPQNRALDHFRRLDPVDGGLHLRIEFLHAETGAVEAERADLLDHLIGERTRIALDRYLGIGCRTRKRSRRRAITAARSPGSSTVGVPPPKCRCETGIRAGSAPAIRSISESRC